MNDELNQLYQQMILEHGRNPRNHHVLEICDCKNDGFNPLCGDQVTVYVKKNGEIIEDVCFEGKGCTISIASASLMSESLKNKTLSEAKEIFNLFHFMVVDRSTDQKWLESNEEVLGKLRIMMGVRSFPMRIKCATMVWHALNDCLNKEE